MLKIDKLIVSIDNIKLINNLNLTINRNEIHIIMGPNGSGKSTLSATLAGDEKYKVLSGKIIFKNQDLTTMLPEERAGMGIFVSFQHSIELPGVNNVFFLHKSFNAIRKYKNKRLLSRFEFLDRIKDNANIIRLSNSLIERCVNVDFSGGEKKRNDILQMMLLKPDLCILDEIDSGLDIDSLKDISKIISKFMNGKRSFIIITHYRHMLDYLKPNYVHILKGGNIIKSGDYSLVKEIMEKGYDKIV